MGSEMCIRDSCSSAPSLFSLSSIGSGAASAFARSRRGGRPGSPALADAPKGADGQAWDLAWDLAVAPATGAVVAGVATDLSKCYDGVRLPLLRRLLAAAGWPAGLVEPLLAA